MMVDMVGLTPRPVSASLDDLLAGAIRREPFLHSDSKSGAPFERVTMADGEVRIVKYVHVDDDWTMRATGDIGNHPAQVWAAGLMDVLPERIDHGVIGVATGLGRGGWGAAIVMRDLGEDLVPPGDDPLPVDEHLCFVDDLAALSARTWGWHDDVGLVPLGNRLAWFNHAALEVEGARGWPDAVPKIALDGWGRFAERAPGDVAAAVDTLRHDPSPLIDDLAATPQCFLHGDWKLGNLGRGGDGRTVLIDWTYPGEGPCTFDLGWYLALNAARLPVTKEATIARFASSLRTGGVDTDGWFDRQLALASLAIAVLFGWEKALGADAELGWWCDRAREGLARL